MRADHPNLTSDNRSLTRVTFELGESNWHGYETESVWAASLGDGRYRIENVPFYACGVSYDDIVVAKPKDGLLIVQEVAERGGHSTYRVILNRYTTDDEFKAAWEKIESLGCTYERATERLLAIDVPPEADIYAVYAALEEGEKVGVWDFEEAHCGHPLRPS